MAGWSDLLADSLDGEGVYKVEDAIGVLYIAFEDCSLVMYIGA